GMVSRIWWIPSTRLPTVEESRQRLAFLAGRGPTREAFSFAKPFPPPVDVTSIPDARQACVMLLPAQLFLDGACRNSASDRRTTLINPATEEPFGEVAAAAVADVNAAVESARRGWESG